MNYEDLADDTALTVEPTTPPEEKTTIAIQRSIAQIESAMNEFARVQDGLKDLRARFPVDLVFDVTTTKGMAEAVAHRAAWRNPRIAVEKHRSAAKSPVLALGRDIDARAAWLTEQLRAGEEPVHQQIKCEEVRRAKEKADREAAEFGRTLAITEAIAEISMDAQIAAGKSSQHIADHLNALRTVELKKEEFQEMMPAAIAARDAAIAKLEVAFKAKQWDEQQEAARVAAEQARLKRQAEEDAERARVAEEQRIERQRLAEAAAEQKRKDEALAAREAELDRLLAEARAAAAPKPEPVTETAPAADLLVEPPIPPYAAPGPEVAAEPAPPLPPVVEHATLSAGNIAARLGFALPVEYVVNTLGVPPALTRGRATLWSVSQFRAICAALIVQINSVAESA